MSYVSEYLTQAEPADRWTIQARAERMRGDEMRRMASALKRRIATAVAGLARRRTAGRLIQTSRFRMAP